MIREMIGRLFNFYQEIEALQQQVADLSWDAPFGMLTRTAFLQLCKTLPPRSRTIMFIDLNNIGILNLTLGYSAVDQRIRETFSCLHPPHEIPARWFSGDEIVVLFDEKSDPVHKIVELYRAGESHGIRFTYEAIEWDSGKQTIQSVIEPLSERVCASKQRYYQSAKSVATRNPLRMP